MHQKQPRRQALRCQIMDKIQVFQLLLFDENQTGEDFAFLNKILTTNYVITPEIFYKVGH